MIQHKADNSSFILARFSAHTHSKLAICSERREFIHLSATQLGRQSAPCSHCRWVHIRLFHCTTWAVPLPPQYTCCMSRWRAGCGLLLVKLLKNNDDKSHCLYDLSLDSTVVQHIFITFPKVSCSYDYRNTLLCQILCHSLSNAAKVFHARSWTRQSLGGTLKGT